MFNNSANSGADALIYSTKISPSGRPFSNRFNSLESTSIDCERESCHLSQEELTRVVELMDTHPEYTAIDSLSSPSYPQMEFVESNRIDRICVLESFLVAAVDSIIELIQLVVLAAFDQSTHSPPSTDNKNINHSEFNEKIQLDEKAEVVGEEFTLIDRSPTLSTREDWTDDFIDANSRISSPKSESDWSLA